MKPKKKSGLNLSKKTKIIATLSITLFVMTMIIISYKYGFVIGMMTGYNKGVGTEGMCDLLNKTMDGEYCVLNEPDKYAYYVDCPHGKMLAYDDEENKLINYDVRLLLLQCDVNREEILK